MKTHVHLFAADEDGAVTVDWVVLTAALVGLAMAVVGVFANGTKSVGDTVEGELSDIGSRISTGTVLN